MSRPTAILRRAPLLSAFSSARTISLPIRARSSYQCLHTPAARLPQRPQPPSRISGQWHQTSVAGTGKRAFSSTGSRGKTISPGMRRSMEELRKPQAQPSVATMSKNKIEHMSNDMGLLPETFVRPTGANLPGLFSEPKLRWKVEKNRIKTWFTDNMSLLIYKFFTRSGKPRPIIGIRKLPKLAKVLHKEMYTAFAFGDMDHIQRICADGLASSFRARLNSRAPNERLYWSLLSSSRPRIVSYKAVSVPVPGIPKDRPCAMRQVVVCIKSRQALVRGFVNKDRSGKEWLVDSAGEQLEVDEDGEVTKARMEREGRSVKEYVVLQRRMWMGKEEGWLVWGLTEETSVDQLKLM